MDVGTKRVILIADDAKTSRMILRKVFGQQYDILEAENGLEAIAALRERRDIAIVLLDIVMPQMDGFGVLSAMRDDSEMRSVPVIVMTASTDEETQMKALSAGAMDVLYKPINSQVTQKRVENLITRMDSIRLFEQNRAIKRELAEAETDIISGIYNKNAFLRRTAQYLSEYPEKECIILRWDMDNFKVYNDVYGREAGNEFLRSVGDFCREHRHDCPGMLLYARFESDHFVCLWEAGGFDAHEISMAVQEKLHQIQTRAFDMTLRLGLFRINDTFLDVALMCDRALLALKSVKNDYNRHYAWYEDSMRDDILREHDITSQMKDALALGQFKVYFQPQYNYTKGTLIGAEALVRWIHPEKGVIAPNVFIPIFERNGFIYELDHYVWEQACAYIKNWKNLGMDIPPISVSVNISRKDLYQPDIVEHICSLPDKYGIDPAMLHLEITESAYIDSSELVVRVVGKLQEHGFNVEMDDFGSGYSSLNTLKDVPVDMLKLDMRFLAGKSDGDRGGKILSSIVRMAHEINLPVIAEDVETKTQAEFLKSIGCHFMQGYYFSRPMPAEDFEKLLISGTVSPVKVSSENPPDDGLCDFMDYDSQSTLLFNSFVGGAAILEYSEGRVAALRINDRYFQEIGTDRESYAKYQYDLLERMSAESRTAFTASLDKAVSSGSETECEIRSLPLDNDGPGFWSRCRFRCLTKKMRGYLFYLSVENITERKNLEHKLANNRLTL